MNPPMMENKGQSIRNIIIIFGVFLAFCLAGCSSDNEITQFPIGLFDCVECQGFTERYSADGTLIVYMKGYKFISGKWFVEGDVFHTGDSFCQDLEKMPATYKWKFDGDILTFRVIEDECSDRVSSMDGKPWKLIEE